MKTFLTILFLFSIRLYAQTGKLKLQIKILPELKEILKDEEITVHIWNDSIKRDRIVVNPDIVWFDSLVTASTVLIVTSTVRSVNKARVITFEKEYFLNTPRVTIKNDSTTTVVIEFPKDCGYNKVGNNKVCPKCKRSDRVIPILYGLRIPIYDEKGNIAIKDPKNYPGGCDGTDCDPTWYCERDKLKF